ncbi:hypothetical protein UlMin_041262 [Ulmus minor]
MASEAEMSEISSLFERLVRSRDLSLFIPFMFGFSNTIPRRESQNPDQESSNRPISGDRVILINPFTQGTVVIEGVEGMDSLLRELDNKGAQPPASQASIEAMACVPIGEDDQEECVICLEEFGVGEVAREMPCKHRFHGCCIEKWLGIHGSCPVCRFKMPVDEEEVGKKGSGGDDGRERRRVEREIWVSFSFNGSGIRSQGLNHNSAGHGDGDDDSTSAPDADHEMQD